MIDAYISRCPMTLSFVCRTSAVAVDIDINIDIVRPGQPGGDCSLI